MKLELSDTNMFVRGEGTVDIFKKEKDYELEIVGENEYDDCDRITEFSISFSVSTKTPECTKAVLAWGKEVALSEAKESLAEDICKQEDEIKRLKRAIKERKKIAKKMKKRMKEVNDE